MFERRGSSITKKLTRMNVFVSGAALLTACATFVVYDVATFRQALVSSLSIQAHIVGSSSASALLFNDPHTADSTLSALSASPNIISAGIYSPNGRLFASYQRASRVSILAPPPILARQAETHLFADGKVTLTREIVFQGKLVGTIRIESDLERLNERLKRYAGIAGLVLAASLLAALLISPVFQGSIADPIVGLARIAQSVSSSKDYSVRAVPTSSRDEISVLIKSFNEMLAQIQSRDAALQKARDELERRVEERTKELAAANKELEAFSYSVSHDLRAPLRQIDGFSSILAERYAGQLDADARHYLKRVQEGARNMGRLVDDLLSMGHISRQELVRKPTDLNVLIEGVLRDLQSECEGRQIEWRISVLPTVDCDPGLMKLVFANLLSNAVKYSRGRTPAVIEVGQVLHDGSLAFSVRDNGAGFDQQYAHKLFGVFQRLHRADEFEGNGVGLATVQRIIQKHGGRVSAQGEVGRGATFFFTVWSSHHDARNLSNLHAIEVKQ